MRIDIPFAAGLLRANDKFEILCHAAPDGDTVGCGFALCRVLQQMGKQAFVTVDDVIPACFDYLFPAVEKQSFAPEFIIAVDVATLDMLGSETHVAKYRGRIDLCIDHHASNTDYAKYTLLETEPEASAAAETLLQVFYAMGALVDPMTADCIYTGIATDTGCFRYTNTTSRTFRIAADLLDKGARLELINKRNFDTRTKTYSALEALALATLNTYFDGKCAMLDITQEMYRLSGSDESEAHPLKALPRQVEGALVGVTVKEEKDGRFRASVRTNSPVDACNICKRFGGGGHKRASGCDLPGDTIDEAKKNILESIRIELEKL
ncbi:MAG: bifunctional oligoribonuclease/PAP phosphatase NrnA [Clostridia bacterium]|nr:bifunctional oligoribonuclease/PAP phosphatase NrnA [Clostridia bacterium]